MKDIFYPKKSNVEKLGQELRDAGFDIYGCSSGDEEKTVVHLKDTEVKDPKAIVDKHIYTKPKTSEELAVEAKAERDAKIAALPESDKLKILLKEYLK